MGTPHLLYRFHKSFVNGKSLYFPKVLYVLPGSLYAHELHYSNTRNNLVVNVTGFNELSTISIDSSEATCSSFYTPSFFIEKVENCTQINSFSEKSADIFAFTCFAFSKSSYKPWKDEAGPLELGSLVE